METNIVIMSDTHDLDMPPLQTTNSIDVLIHCGDLTKGSTLDEMKRAVAFLESVPAALKLVIPGNHEITLDDEAFAKHLAAAGASDVEASRAYGLRGEARALFTKSKSLTLLDEGSHRFVLPSGATLNVYASPWTPRMSNGALSMHEPGWAFQHDVHDGAVGGHEFRVPPNTDIAITHGPPRGILDMAGRKRTGCPDLFDAVAKSQPRLHCFGHIHSGWGAKEVSWRPEMPEHPTHFDAIDNDKSSLIMNLRDLKVRKPMDGDAAAGQPMEAAAMELCEAAVPGDRGNGSTLFVNASIEGNEEMPLHPAWIVKMVLPITNAIE